MKRRSLFLALPGSCAALLAAGQGKGKGRDRKAQEVPGFLPDQRKIILAYFQNPPSGLPPGLGKRAGDLPPGLEKQVRRKGQLPPGLQKRLAPLPPDLAARLPVLPPDHARAILGHLAIVWNSRTGLVLDVLVLEGR
jgi:hypothetical protein